MQIAARKLTGKRNTQANSTTATDGHVQDNTHSFNILL